ncbi:MAG: DNA-binding protein WhiA [Pseudoflavonifractor sp.]
MSFSAETKAELCRAPLTRKCCALAETYGVLLFCNCFSAREIRVMTESAEFAARLPLLLHKCFRLEFDSIGGEPGGKRTFLLTAPAKLAAIRAAYGYDPVEGLAHHINFAMLEEEHCRTAFFRGAFLTGGSVTDPRKRYHLELVTSHYNVSRELSVLLMESGFVSKETTRKSNYMTYFKQSEYIEEFLTSIGAPIATMELMNAKLEKNLRGSVNRRVNCDAANLDKAVDAAQDQLEAIRHIEQTIGLDALGDKLRKTALLRMEYPELTLTQLAELCDPPVTKSCLNHRLRKLIALAGETQTGTAPDYK